MPRSTLVHLPDAVSRLLTAALRHSAHVTREACAEFDQMTPDEWAAMKRRARRTGRGPSAVTDADLIAYFDDKEHNFVNSRGRKLTKEARYRRTGVEFGLRWTTVRDRVLAAKKNL